MIRFSGPIRVFNDDTFVVEFQAESPIVFKLTTFQTIERCGTYADDIFRFDDGTLPIKTDLRVLIRAYRTWAGVPHPELFSA